MLSSRNAVTVIFIPEILIVWFMEQTSSLMSNLYSLSDADANTKLRLGTATVSDQRISLMNQVVSGIGTVKIHA